MVQREGEWRYGGDGGGEVEMEVMEAMGGG